MGVSVTQVRLYTNGKVDTHVGVRVRMYVFMHVRTYVRMYMYVCVCGWVGQHTATGGNML